MSEDLPWLWSRLLFRKLHIAVTYKQGTELTPTVNGGLGTDAKVTK
jgi:hypothetical protein